MVATELEVIAPITPAEGELAHLDGDCGGTGALHRRMPAGDAMEAGLEPCPDCCPDDVFVGPSTASGRRAHPDEDCRYVGDKHSEWDIALVLSWGIPICKLCRDGDYGGGWSGR